MLTIQYEHNTDNMSKADLDKAFKELVEVEQLLDAELTVESATQISNLFQSLKIRMKQLIEKPQIPVDVDYDNKCKEFSLRMKTGLVKFKEQATKITNANKPAMPIEPRPTDPVPEPRVVPPLSRAASEVSIGITSSATSSANTSKRNSMQLDVAELNNSAVNGQSTESGSAPQTTVLSAQSTINPKLDAPPSPSKSRMVFKMKGYLKKQGEKGLKSWRRRYFRLVHHSLAYYHENGDERPINSIDLTQMTTARVTEGQSFDIETTTRVWHLEAESAADARHWVNALLLWKKNWERPQIKPVSAESAPAPLDEEIVPEASDEGEDESESARREREAREGERNKKREERLKREAERQAERERREQERRERELREQAETETATSTTMDTSLRSSVDSLESTSGASTSSKDKKKDKKGFFGFMKRHKGTDMFPESLNLLGQELNARETGEERRDSIAPVIIHDYRGEQREGGEEVPVVVVKPKTREQIEQERTELLHTREEQIKKKEQLLEQLKKELPGLEAQRREQERLEREAEAQHPEMIALNDAVNEQEHEIQLYATTQDIYDQEIQQQKHKFDELFKQETKLEHEMSQLHQELRVSEAKLREVQQESEMAAGEALRLDGEVQSLKEAREARSSTDDPRVLIAELRRAIRTQKEAQEAHLAQAEFLGEELQRVQATCANELEEMDEKVDNALRQFKLRRARLQELRASSLKQVSLADELEAIRKDYFCSLVLGSKLTASIQRQPLGTSLSATAMYDRALEENVPVNAWPGWIADKFSV